MINKVILIGNVGADPEVRALEGGNKVARIRLATTERMYNRTTQETREHTEWHTIVAWRNLADIADKYIKKGSQIYIEGRLRSRDWTDAEGHKRYSIEIIADEIRLLGRRSDNPASATDSYQQGAAATNPAASQVRQPSQPTEMPPSDDPDDLPF